MTDEDYYLCFDTEFANGNENSWFAVGAVVAEHKSRSIVDSVEIYRKPRHALDDEFWKNNSRSLDYLLGKANEHTDETSEMNRLCSFITDTFERHPYVRVCTDNPSSDIPIVNDILRTRGHSEITRPRKGSGLSYHSVMCIKTLGDMARRIHHSSTASSKRVGIKHEKLQIKNHDIRHTPVHDAVRSLNDLFLSLDTIQTIVDDRRR